MKRYVYRRPFDFGRRLRLSKVLIAAIVASGAAPPATWPGIFKGPYIPFSHGYRNGRVG